MGSKHEIDRYKDVSDLAGRSRGIVSQVVGDHLEGLFAVCNCSSSDVSNNF